MKHERVKAIADVLRREMDGDHMEITVRVN